jgi:hypothetical protein
VASGKSSLVRGAATSAGALYCSGYLTGATISLAWSQVMASRVSSPLAERLAQGGSQPIPRPLGFARLNR